MSEVVRLDQCKSQLVGRLAMSAEDLMARLEISRATLKRDIAKLRNRPSTASPASAVARRTRIMYAGKRVVQAKAFEAVTAATREVSDKTNEETVGVGYGSSTGLPRPGPFSSSRRIGRAGWTRRCATHSRKPAPSPMAAWC